MRIAISSESACDLPKDLLVAYQIKTLPYMIVLGEKEGADGVLTPDDLFAYFDATGQAPQNDRGECLSVRGAFPDPFKRE
jgi:fatty acid-binding protein DegV